MTTNEWFLKDFPFDKYAEEVALWNVIGYGYHDTSEVRINRQWQLVHEEGVVEFWEAFVEKDPKEFLDAVVDSFVVGTYLKFLEEGCTQDLKYINIQAINFSAMRDIGFIVNFMQRSITENSIENTLVCVFALMHLVDADVIGAIKDVLKSNWSKYFLYDPRMEDSFDSWCKRIEGEGRYQGVTWQKRDKYVVWFDENQKILKGPQFREPQLEQFIGK